MTREHLPELRIALRREDAKRVTGKPEDKTRNPELKAETERGRHRAVQDRHAARRAGEQDRFGKGAVKRHFEAFKMAAHAISAPPPKEKKERKKLEAANAIDRPKTI